MTKNLVRNEPKNDKKYDINNQRWLALNGIQWW